MKRYNMAHLLWLAFIFILSGCIVRTYPLTRERVDQDLDVGNRGYVKGESPSEEPQERKTTRTTQVVEVEVQPFVRFEKAPKEKIIEGVSIEKSEDKALWGNRGYITESIIPEPIEPAQTSSVSAVNIEKYTVQKDDTLQKISHRFYRTTKKWNRIYEANKEQLKKADKIYPGQVLNIPLEPLKETPENLK